MELQPFVGGRAFSAATQDLVMLNGKKVAIAGAVPPEVQTVKDRPRGADARTEQLIDGMMFVNEKHKKGLTGRSKTRQKEKEEIDLMTNQVVCTIKQLAKGELTLEALQATDKGFSEVTRA